MLKILRKKGVAKKILWVVAVVIIISFGFFGTANYLSRTNHSYTYAGKIFGETVSFDEYSKAYEHTQHQALLQYGENFSKISPFLNLESETWDRLILLHEAQKRRIKINDAQVIKAIAELPFFARNGKFDPLLYNDVLRYVFKTEPRDFEEGIRETLMFNKLYQQEVAKINLSEEELRQEYKKQNEKIQVSYVLIAAQDFEKSVKLEENEIRQFYEEHKSELLLPPSVNVLFVLLPYPEKITPAQKTELTDKAKQIVQELNTNPDLAAAAKKFDLPVQESGFFSQEQPYLKLGWSYELLKTIFQMNPKEISRPIETEQGVYILQLKEKRESQIPDYKEARERVVQVLTAQKSQGMAKQKAAEYAQSLKEQAANHPEQKLAELAQPLNLTVAPTPLFTRGQYLPNIGLSKEFQEAAFSLSESNKVSDAVETPKGYCILYFDAFTPSDEALFAKEKENFGKTQLIEKGNEAFNQLLTRLKLQANLKDNISKMKKSRVTS